jgi:hypothetical protein
MASIKKLEFASGTAVTEPSDLTVQNSTNHLDTYASDAAFVSANGAAVAGDLYLNTSTENPRVYVSGAFKEIGSGGAGGRNYVSSEFEGTRAVGTVTNGLTATGNRTTNQDTWGADNTAKLTIANNTSSPLRQSGDFKITHVTTGTAFVESRMFNIDTADLGKAVSIAFDLTGSTTAADFDIVVMRYNSSGTYQETISVAGTASSGTPASALLPTGTTKFNGFFIAGSTQSDYYALRFRRLSGSATTSVQFDSLFVGPQSIITGAIISDLASLTWTVSNNGSKVFTIRTSQTRVGRYMIVKYGLLGDATASGSAATDALLLNMPTGYTIDNTALPNTASFANNENVIGYGQTKGIISSGNFDRAVVAFSASTSTIAFQLATTANSIRTTDLNAANAMEIYGELRIPIVEWSSSNTTLADRAVEEYAYNTSVADSDDTTSFGNGAGGVMFGSFTAPRNKTVRFQTPILATDVVSLEFFDTTTWLPMGSYSNGVIPLLTQNTTEYGMTLDNSSSSTTDMIVHFGTYRISTGATFASAGSAWSGIAANASFKWRVRKVSGGASVGYPIGAANIVGRTDGTTVGTGFIGQVIQTTNVSANSVTGSASNVTSIPLTPGVWSITAALYISGSSGTFVNMGISTNSASFTGCVVGYSQLAYAANATAGVGSGAITIPVNIAANTTYYLVATTNMTGLSGSLGSLTAVRIA